MRTVKLAVAIVLASVWLAFAIAGWLVPSSVWILGSITAGFSVGCALSYLTYYNPFDEFGRVWAEKMGRIPFFICLLCAALPCLINPNQPLMVAAGVTYAIPIFLIGRIRPERSHLRQRTLREVADQSKALDD